MSAVGYDFEAEEEWNVDPKFRIDGANSANWALAKLRYYKRRKQEIEDLHRAEQERIDAWAKREVEKLAPSIEYFEHQLIDWHREQFEADEKRKSIVLPNGTLRSKAGTDKPVVTNEEAFFASAPEGTVRIKREVDKPALSKHVKETGELPPGVELVPGERTFKVEVEQ